MDYTALAFWFAAAQFLFTALGGWIAKSLRDLRREIAASKEAFESQAAASKEASDARMDGFEARVVQCEELSRHNVIARLGVLEQALSSAATGDQVARIHARIDDLRDDDAKLATDIGEVKGLVQAQSSQLQIIQQHLLERGGVK